MSSNYIMRSSGKVVENIFHIDLMQYNIPYICSSFILKTNDSVVVFDCGTSKDVSTLIEYFEGHRIPLSKIDYLIPSHYHFDHFGGGWKLWEIISEKNPNVKILTTEKTKEYLQSPETHMMRAKRTYGSSIGEMKSIQDNAYEIIVPDQEIEIQGLPENQKLKLEGTSGHTPDHITPTLYNDETVSFMHLGEAAGTLMHATNLVTLGTSMPPEFHFSKYISSLKKIISKEPANIGLGHFGVVLGKEFTTRLLKENLEFTYFFRKFVKEKYGEKGETRYIVEQFLETELPKRVDAEYVQSGFLTNVIVALVYGQLIDLGLRKPK